MTSKERAKEILKSGTPKQKAAIYCENSYYKQFNIPIITDEEEKELMASINTYDAAQEFDYWLKMREFLRGHAVSVSVQINEVKASISELTALLEKWDIYEREIKRLNELFHNLKDDDLLNMKRKDIVKLYTYPDAKVKFNARSNRFVLDIDGEKNLYGKIQRKAENYEEDISFLKGLIQGYFGFVNDMNAKPFVHQILTNGIKNIKDYDKAFIYPWFSKRVLKEREAAGEQITAEERKKAVFPDWNDIPADGDFFLTLNKYIKKEWQKTQLYEINKSV